MAIPPTQDIPSAHGDGADPHLQCARLRLRTLAAGDEALYCRLYGDAGTMQQVASPLPPAQSRRSFLAALRLQTESPPLRRFWAILPQGDTEPAGLVGLVWDTADSAELGVVLPPAHQGRGLATATIRLLATHAFDQLGLKRLHTRHVAGHDKAAALMRGLAFEPLPRMTDAQDWHWQLTQERWAMHGQLGAVKTR